MDSLIKYAQKKGVNYVEINSSRNSRNMIELQNGEVKELSGNESNLYSIRLQYKNSVGVAYSNNDDYKDLVDKAIKIAKTLNQNIKLNPKANIKNFKTKVKKRLNDIPLEEKKKIMLNLEKLKKDYKKINTLRLIYSDGIRKINYVNSEGADLKWNDSNIGFMSWAYSKDGERNENYLNIDKGHLGFELMDKSEKIVKESMDIATKLLKSKLAKAGNFPVIVDQKLGGVFIHEAIGHASEADIVLSGASVLKDKLNNEVGNSCINVIDDGSAITNGWTPFDSDGMLGSKTMLIKKGVMEKYMQSLETSSIMDIKSTGNGRAESLMKPIIPRMTTTYLDKGNSSFDEMLNGIKEGYYLKGSAGGQVDTGKGEFLFNSMYGYYIKDGKVDYMVKTTSLIGNILQTLFNISLVGKDLEIYGGTCGKNDQWVPVGDGSPHFKIEKARVGGQE